MYVCVCNAVTDSQIHQAVKDGARTVKHLKEQLNVASECAACVSCAKSCIKAAQADLKQKNIETAFNDKVINIADVRRNVA